MTWYRRSLTAARCDRDGTTRLDACLDLCLDGDPIRARFTPAAPVATGAAADAARWYEQIHAALPLPRQGTLLVEAGCVEDRRAAPGTPGRVIGRRPYAIATCGGLVWDPSADTGSTSPWDGVVDAADVPPGASVILGPSAVLTLCAGLLADVEAGEPGVDWSAIPGATLRDVAASPYPPQHIPARGLDLLGTLAEPGRWTESGALSLGHGRNLEVCWAPAPVPRAPFLILDAWQSMCDHWTGTIDVLAEYTLVAHTGQRRCGARPLRLRLDTVALLRAVRGATGPRVPAVEQHPILGARFGQAPPLALAPMPGAGAPWEVLA